MRIGKKDIIPLCIVILLFMTILFLPSIIGLIPSERVKLAISIMIWLSIVSCFIYGTYNDITKRQFTTTSYIILVDIIIIAASVTLTYTIFKKPDISNPVIILRENRIRTITPVILFLSIALRNFLKGQRFLKKI